MSFLNATLIFGSLTIAIPIVMHLLSRRQPKRVSFPSIGFLKPKATYSKSRVQIKRWWLLAARVALLAILSIALAQPIISADFSSTWFSIAAISFLGFCLLILATVGHRRGLGRSVILGLACSGIISLAAAITWSTLTAAKTPVASQTLNNPQAVAIIIDNGPSSAWTEKEGSRLAQMKSACEKFIKQLPARSQVCIIDRSARNATFSIDQVSALNKLKQLNIVQSVQPIDNQIAIARSTLETSRLGSQQILVFSDFSEYSWDGIAPFETDNFTNKQGSINLTLFDLGEFEGQNWGLTNPQLSDRSPAPNTPTPIGFTAYSESSLESAETSITVELEVFQNAQSLPMLKNGAIEFPSVETADRTSVRLANNGRRELVLNLPSLPLGIHHGRIRLAGKDATTLDNERYFSIEVLPATRILIVSDEPAASRVVFNAIGATENATQGSEYLADTISFADLPLARLDSYEVVALLDPPASIATIKKAVGAYLQTGGKLLVSLGQQSTIASIQEVWFPGRGISPEEVNKPKRWRSPTPGTFIQPITVQHPILHSLVRNVPWANHRIEQYWSVKAEPTDSVLMNYAGTDQPAVIEREVTNQTGVTGKLILLTTPFPAVADDNKKWNQLFGENAWPAWLLCRESIDYLANRSSGSSNAMVGQTFALQLSKEQGSLNGGKVFMFEPGRRQPKPIIGLGASQFLRINDVAAAGTYWIRGEGLENGFSANLDPQATSMTRIDPITLTAGLNAEQYQVITNLEAMKSFTDLKTKRIPLHSPAILLAAIVFILENILGNRFYQNRSRNTENNSALASFPRNAAP